MATTAEDLQKLLDAIREYRKLAESQPLTLQRSDYPHAVLKLDRAIEQAERLLR